MDCSVQTQVSSGSSLYAEDTERNYLKEKVEHFKVLIRKLQDEVQSHKVQKEGAETVSKLLQESKLQGVALQRKNKTYESVIRNLQSRLENNGLSSEITLQEGEEFVPGHSKNLLDNLTRENTRLRNIVRTNAGDPEELAKLQQHISEQHLSNTKLQTHLATLEQLLRSSDNEKDKTITELREELLHAQRELNTRANLCTTLAEQTHELQRQLKNVAHQCQDLAKRLHEQGQQGHTEQNICMEKLQKMENKDMPDGDKTTTEENEALKQKVKEITEMNKRWQDYNNQRESYVKQLQSELSELKTRESTAQATAGNNTHEVEVQINKVLDEARKNVNKAKGERDHIRRELDAANRQIIALSEQLQQQRGRNEIIRTNDSTEIIEALKAQIQICTEDFESERKDREKAQSRLGRVEFELDQLKKENELLKRDRQAWQATPQIPQQYSDPFYHYQLPGSNHGNFNQEGLAPRGISKKEVTAPRRNIDKYNVIDGQEPHIQSDGIGETNNIDNIQLSRGANNDANDGEDNYVSLRTSSISSNSKEHASFSPRTSCSGSHGSSPVNSVPIVPLTTKSDIQVLKCPKCDKNYSSEDHAELLEHIETCCE